MRWALIAALCLGVWLHAADTLVATTVMPSAIADIGGLAFVYWTIALYELGSIVAGAVAGLAVVRVGVRDAMCAAAAVYALGCAASALAPSMDVMLAGRLLQGLGGGAMLALSYVGVSAFFPAEEWPRLLGVISGVWGVSALLGPLVGGALASIGLWRGAFWAFGAQALLLALLMPLLVGRESAAAPRREALPVRQLLVLSVAVLAISAAGVQASGWRTSLLVGLGLVALWQVLDLERGAPSRLFPPEPLRFALPWGAGYAMVLALATATVSFTVYGPLLMARLFGVTPLGAGLMVAVESFAWTLAALVFARAPERAERSLIRGGAVLITAGVLGFALTMPRGPVWMLLPPATLQGAGFGMCWAFLLRRIVVAVPEGERERASSAVPTMQMIGYAVGAAASGMVANMLGFADGASAEVVGAVAFWVFAAFLPLALIGVAAAWRLTRPA
jgi:MFS family permease